MNKTTYQEQIAALQQAIEYCKKGGLGKDDMVIPRIAQRIRWMQDNDRELTANPKEVKRGVARNGVVYRIRKSVLAYDIWEIEYQRVYKYPNGEECIAWFAAFEPKQKLFTNWDEVNEMFNKFLEGEPISL